MQPEQFGQTATEDEGITIVDVPEKGRYEISAGGQLAGFCEYQLRGSQLVLPHTVIEARFEGRGFGSQLIAFALDDARSRGLRVVPSCSFVAAYINDHPQYAGLVA